MKVRIKPETVLFKCEVCGVRADISIQDVWFSSADQWASVECCICEHHNHVSAETLPPEWRTVVLRSREMRLAHDTLKYGLAGQQALEMVHT